MKHVLKKDLIMWNELVEAVEKGDIDRIKTLIENDALLAFENQPIIWKCRYNVHSLQFLIENDYTGTTPQNAMDIALGDKIYGICTPAVKALLEKYSIHTFDVQKILATAFQWANVELVEYILSIPNAIDFNNKKVIPWSSFFNYQVHENKKAALRHYQYLVTTTKKLSVIDENKYNLLKMQYDCGEDYELIQTYIELIQLLLKKGANINAVDCTQSTLLHVIVKIPQMATAQMVQFLVDNGADLYAKDSNGRTPFDCCTTIQSGIIIFDAMKEKKKQQLTEFSHVDIPPRNLITIRDLEDTKMDIHSENEGLISPKKDEKTEIKPVTLLQDALEKCIIENIKQEGTKEEPVEEFKNTIHEVQSNKEEDFGAKLDKLQDTLNILVSTLRKQDLL